MATDDLSNRKSALFQRLADAPRAILEALLNGPKAVFVDVLETAPIRRLGQNRLANNGSAHSLAAAANPLISRRFSAVPAKSRIFPEKP